jgi:hypothetical protein
MFVIKINTISPVIPELQGVSFLGFDSMEEAVLFINKHWEYYAKEYVEESALHKQVYDSFIQEPPSVSPTTS